MVVDEDTYWRKHPPSEHVTALHSVRAVGADQISQVWRPVKAHPKIMGFPKEKRILWIRKASLWNTHFCDVSLRSVSSRCATRNGVSA